MTADTLIAKQEIRDALSRYCRGLDRMDKQMVLNVWHEGGTADYVGVFEGTGAGFVDWVWGLHGEHMQCHSHQITNVLAEVTDDRATSESYVTVALWTKPDREGQVTEIVSRGRYLDRWGKRNGRWAIEHRIYVSDQTRRLPIGAPAPGEGSHRSTEDPSFAFVAKATEPRREGT